MDGAVFLAVFAVGCTGKNMAFVFAIGRLGTKIPKSPTAVGAFEKSCENLCFAVLLRSFAAVDVRLCLISKLL